jgi:hypothetical protein
MSSYNFINNALTQLFNDVEDKCHVKFNTFTANDKPMNKGINADQEYMKQYHQQEDKRTYKYLYDPDLNFDFRFHQRMARINYGTRKEPWCSLMFNTQTIRPLTNVLSHVYDGMQYADFEVIDKETKEKKIVQKGVDYKFRRVLCPINFVLISNELSYLYHISENMAMYFDRWINYTYQQTLTFSPLTTVTWDLVGAAQNIRQVNLEKLDTESKGSLAMMAFSFELIYWDIWSDLNEYGLLERVILEVHEAKTGKLLFLDICE